jgi:uncharacterized damage-inducible protein DinB
VTSELEQDLQSAREGLAAAREVLLAVVTALSDDDLEQGKRGGWTVRRVLEHVIESEWIYSRLTAHLRGLPVPGDAIDAKPASVADARDRLAASRAALLHALEGVDEESFYRLVPVRHEEYSVFSLLENTINHDREHAAQVRSILARD